MACESPLRSGICFEVDGNGHASFATKSHWCRLPYPDQTPAQSQTPPVASVWPSTTPGALNTQAACPAESSARPFCQWTLCACSHQTALDPLTRNVLDRSTTWLWLKNEILPMGVTFLEGTCFFVVLKKTLPCFWGVPSNNPSSKSI